MKNKKAESLFRKKGFYVALYSCLGIVMITAAVFSFSSLLTNDPPAPIKSQVELDYNALDLEDLQPVDNSITRSYLTPEDREALGLYPVSTATPRVTATPLPDQQPTAAPTAVPAASPTAEASAEKTAPTTNPVQTPTPAVRSSEDLQEENHTADATESDGNSNNETDIEAAIGFTPYTAEAPMNWPVVGELVMDFSTSSLIYDQTLNLYRTNDNLCIGAAMGTQVKATVGGVVKEITNTREKGNTIVLDHGNGWQTSYSELQDGILVKEGDVVTVGQVIGGVGTPSIYNVLMGSHLQFAVTKDGVKIDPKTVLASN